jgi:hypothetical protein
MFPKLKCFVSLVYVGMRSERKAPKKWSTISWFLLHENAPAHQSVVVKNFLAKNNVTTLEHPPYSPDLAPVDFYMFPRLKSALKVRCISHATDIKNAMDELNRVSQKGYQACLQLIAGGGLFRRKCSLNCSFALYFS